jgi:protein phosphatase
VSGDLVTPTPASYVPSVRFEASAAGRTDSGRVRDHNEDRLRLYRALDLYIVADGMGGHNAGEVASALASASIENCFRAGKHSSLPEDLLEDERALSEPAQRLVASVRKANRDVYEISTTHREHKGMGTTVVAVHVDTEADLVHIAHVGDSRCYRIRDGAIEQVTRDHSLIGDVMLWKPDVTEKELAMLPKNMISRAVGRRPTVEVDLRSDPLVDGDVYLLCSDGLSGMVNDASILSIVTSSPDLDAACDALIAAANEAGGEDNVTALLVRIDSVVPD